MWMIPFIFLTLYENLWIVFHPHMNSKWLDSFFYNHVLSYHGFVFKYLLLFLFFLLCTSVAVNQVDNPLETERTKRIGLHPSDPNYFYRKFLLNKRSDMVYIYWSRQLAPIMLSLLNEEFTRRNIHSFLWLLVALTSLTSVFLLGFFSSACWSIITSINYFCLNMYIEIHSIHSEIHNLHSSSKLKCSNHAYASFGLHFTS